MAARLRSGLIGILPACLLAQAPSSEGPWDFKSLLALRTKPVYSASLAPQDPREAPAKVVLITEDDIRSRGYLDFEELLHDLAGIDFNKVMGVEFSTVFMRGFRSANSDRFLLIWDGVVQNDVWRAANSISRQYPLSSIQRIEVLYGPASLLYGPNAFSGIINVVLREEKDVQGVEVQAAAGAFRSRLVEVNAGRQNGPWRYMFTGRYWTSNEDHMDGKHWVDQGGRKRLYSLRFPADFVPPTDPKYALDVQDGRLYYTNRGRRVAFQEGFTHDSRDWFLQAGLGYGAFTLRAHAWSMLEDQSAWHTAQHLVDSPRNPKGAGIQARWVHALGQAWVLTSQATMRSSSVDLDDGWFTNAKAYFTNNAADPKELKVYTVLPSGYAGTFNREYKAGQQAAYASPGLLVSAGWEYALIWNHEDYRSMDLATQAFSYTPVHDERNLGLFLNVQRDLVRGLSANVGLRHDYNYLAGERGGFGHLDTPRLALLYRPSEAHAFKAIFAKSYQNPPAFQKFSTVPIIRELPSPGLQPERLRSWEFMYTWSPAHPWQATLNAYRTRVADFIVAASVPFGSGTTTRFINRGELEIQGLEFEGSWAPVAEMKVGINATWTRAFDPATGRKTGDIAPFKANAALDYRPSSRFGASLRAHHVARRDTVNWDSRSIYVARSVDAYTSLDLALSWFRIRPGLDLRITANNLLNREYYDPGPRSADGKVYNGAVLQLPFRFAAGINYRF